MPEPEAADTVQDDPVDQSQPAPTLDQVHRVSQAAVEEEDFGDAEDTPAVDDESEVDEDSKSGDDEVVDEEAGDEADEEPANVEPTKDDIDVKTASDDINTDITQKGEGKVAIKNTEGETFYFNNLDEVPDDFQPLSYKALMAGTKELLIKEQKDAEDAAKALDEQVQAENDARAQAMQESWETDAKTLSEQGLLPKAGKELEDAKEEVYSYIESEMKKGNIITSFSQAYKSMQYDRIEAEKAAEKAKLDKAKKDRGAMVQSGSGGGSPSVAPKAKVIAAPPQGATLDMVHNNVISTL